MNTREVILLQAELPPPRLSRLCGLEVRQVLMIGLYGKLPPELRFTQELTTFTNLYGIFTPPLRLFTPLYAPLQITFCKTTTQISDYIDLVLALSRSRSGYY